MKLLLTLILTASFFAVGCAHRGHRDHGKKHWAKMDTDKDGAVSKAEFDKAHADMFTAMDADKDGKVTKEEKKAFFNKKKDCGCGDKKAEGKAEQKAEDKPEQKKAETKPAEKAS